MARFIAIIVTLFLQFSVCTGGILSAASVLAANVSTDSFTTASLSTPSGDIFLCESATPDIEQPTQVAKKTTTKPACESSEKCLQQTASDTHERATTMQNSTQLSIDIPASVTIPNDSNLLALIPPTARDGPIYEQASHHANQIQKRE